MSGGQVDTTQDAKRDERGRFEIGAEAERVAGLRRAMLAEVKAEDMAAIMRKLLELAKEGSLQAAKLVLAYALGKPEPLARAAGAAPVAPSDESVMKEAAPPLPVSFGPLPELPGKGPSPSPNGVLDDLRERRLIDVPPRSAPKTSRRG